MIRYLTSAALVLSSLSAFSQDVFYLNNGTSLSITAGTTVTIQGGVKAANGSSILNNGTLCLINNSISNQSNWTDGNPAGVFAAASTGVFTLKSVNGHTITGNTVFPSMIIDADGGTTINNDIAISGNLLLKSGKFTTGIYKINMINNLPGAVQADAANSNYTKSWINGKLQRSITSNTGLYDFPVGNNSQGNLLQFLNNNITGATSLTASFGSKPGDDAGLIITENGTPYTMVNNGGVWYLNTATAMTGGNYALQLYFTGFIGLSDNKFGILRRNDASANAADWVVPAGSALEPQDGNGRKVSDGYARRKNITTFSQYGIGMASVVVPVTLLDFYAMRDDHITVKLNWSTSTEINNKGFEIEKRYENENRFGYIDFVESKAPGGNSNVLLNYIFHDRNPFTGVTYYRLKQVDIDGKFVYSAIKAVKGTEGSEVNVSLMPNPNHGQFTILISGANQSRKAFISDLNGKVIRQFLIQPQQQINISELPAATYVLTIIDVFGKGKNFSEKIIIIK